MRPFISGSVQALLITTALSGCNWSTDASCEELKTCDLTDAAPTGGAGGSTAQSSLRDVRSGGASSTGGLSSFGGARNNAGAAAVTGGASVSASGTPSAGTSVIAGMPSVTGGARAIGGMPSVTGGAWAIGGVPAAGGAPLTGGAPATGGAPPTGGAPTCSPACSGVRAICDLSRLGCVECLDDTECPSGKPKCKTRQTTDAGSELDVCVECVSNSDCRQAAEPVCDSTTNTCVHCLSNGDCKNPAEPVCDASTNTCVGCLNSTDCKIAANSVCDTSAKTCVGCLNSTDCKIAANSVCDTSAKTCVGCLNSTDCKDAAKPLCNASTQSCVACLSNADCKTPEAPKCDLAADSPTENTCLPCSANSDCAHVAGREICKTDTDVESAADAGTSSGLCVQCTTDNETACAGRSCNPTTNVCTSTTKGSRKTCQSCVADSECGTNAGAVDPNSRCVPMTFGGAPHGAGGYCLQTVSAGCSKPYAVSFTAISLSGAPAEAYCGINQSATTCEAVLDLASATICTMEADCGGGQGGLCKAISVVAPANRCTIPCGTDAQCPSGSTCSGTTNGWCQ